MGRIDEPKDREAGEDTASPLSRKEKATPGERRKPAGKKPVGKKTVGKKPVGTKPVGKRPLREAAAGKAPRKQFGKPGGQGTGFGAKAGGKPAGFGGRPTFGGQPTGVAARLARAGARPGGSRFGRPADQPTDAAMDDFAERPLRGNIGKRGGMPGINPLGERGRQHLGKPKPFGTPGARFAVQPGAEPLGESGARPLGRPGAKPLGRPGAKFGDQPGGKPLGRPGDQPGGKPLGRPGSKFGDQPGGKPLGRPGAKFGDQPGGKSLGRPGAKFGDQPGGTPLGRPGAKFGDQPGGKPVGGPGARPVGRPGAKPPARGAAKPESDAPTEALSVPTLDPLATAKVAWQPTLTWCVKQLRVTHTMDPAVRAAVELFHAQVKTLLVATDAEQFREAQGKAVLSTMTEHQFLRWAPLPSRLPSL